MDKYPIQRGGGGKAIFLGVKCHRNHIYLSANTYDVPSFMYALKLNKIDRFKTTCYHL